MIANGDLAPDFTLPRDGGGNTTLSDHLGRLVVLYFYPKDETSSCTQEAMDFTNARQAFEQLDATILGVSRDTVARHDKFVAKHDLGIALLSDAEENVCNTYGVWVEKNMYGRRFMGIERSTFLIDRTGAIARIWRKVRVPGHVADVLAAARAL